jgi:hypothetical protein
MANEIDNISIDRFIRFKIQELEKLILEKIKERDGLIKIIHGDVKRPLTKICICCRREKDIDRFPSSHGQNSSAKTGEVLRKRICSLCETLKHIEKKKLNNGG